MDTWPTIGLWFRYVQALDSVRPTVEYTGRSDCVREFTPTDDFVGA